MYVFVYELKHSKCCLLAARWRLRLAIILSLIPTFLSSRFSLCFLLVPSLVTALTWLLFWLLRTTLLATTDQNKADRLLVVNALAHLSLILTASLLTFVNNENGSSKSTINTKRYSNVSTNMYDTNRQVIQRGNCTKE